MYYLIMYQWRNRGEQWRPANAVIDKTPQMWLLEAKRDGGSQEFVLMFWKEISKYEYENLREWL